MASYTNNREIISEAAWHLFWERGYFATSIGDIAKRAKLPKGSVYNYFRSKDDLFAEVVGRLKYQMETELRLKVLEGTLSPAELVGKLLDHYLELFAEYGYGRGDPLGCRLSELADARPELAKRIAPLQAAWRTVVAQKIWGYATSRRIPQLVEHAEALAGFIWAAMQGVLLQMKVAHSAEPLLEAKKTMVPMLEVYLAALATDEIGT